jgi:hypothetical protein
MIASGFVLVLVLVLVIDPKSLFTTSRGKSQRGKPQRKQIEHDYEDEDEKIRAA